VERKYIVGDRRTTSTCQHFTYQHSSGKKIYIYISRKKVSPSVTEVSTEYFQVYRKRDKTGHTLDLLKEVETQSTIVMEGPHSSKFSCTQHIVSTPSSKK
jgi:hypothetical protein